MWSQETGPHSQQPPVKDSDIQDDSAQQLVLGHLQELGERRQEVMLVLSQLNFCNYLNKPCYAAAAEQLPRPCDLNQQDCRGDFDFVIVHRHYGILVAELKSVGRYADRTPSESDSDVESRVERSVKQLDKSERVMRHLVGDIAPGLAVRKTLILPYVSIAQLERVLTANEPLRQVRPGHDPLWVDKVAGEITR